MTAWQAAQSLITLLDDTAPAGAVGCPT